MAGMIGALLGFGGGSLLAAAGEKHRREQAQEDQSRQALNEMFMNHLEQHPELANVPKFANAAKKQMGDAAWTTMLPFFQVNAAANQRKLQSDLAAYQAMGPSAAPIVESLKQQMASLQNPDMTMPGAPSGGAVDTSTVSRPSPTAFSQQPPASVPPAAPGASDLQTQFNMASMAAKDPNLDPQMQGLYAAQAKQLEEQIKKQQDIAAEYSPEAIAGKSQMAGATRQAQLAVDLSPANIQAEAQKATTLEMAKINAQSSPAAIASAVNRTIATTTSRLGVEYSPAMTQARIGQVTAMANAALRNGMSPLAVQAMIQKESTRLVTDIAARGSSQGLAASRAQARARQTPQAAKAQQASMLKSLTDQYGKEHPQPWVKTASAMKDWNKGRDDYIRNFGIDPKTGKLLVPKGLPEGSMDNGDGTWTLPDGTQVSPVGGAAPTGPASTPAAPAPGGAAAALIGKY